MDGATKVSFDAAQLRELKGDVTCNRPYANRISLGFALQLALARAQLNEDHLILDAIDGLESLRPRAPLRKERQFRHSPLHPFWHVHWSAPRHLLRNIGIHWNLGGEGGRDPLTPMLQTVASGCGNDPTLWSGVVVYRTVVEGYEQRAKKGLTGDWIIFAKHEGCNYYLGLATHEEGDKSSAGQLYQKLEQGCAAEFPFLF